MNFYPKAHLGLDWGSIKSVDVRGIDAVMHECDVVLTDSGLRGLSPMFWNLQHTSITYMCFLEFPVIREYFMFSVI